MNVAFISPSKNCGCTTVAALAAASLSATQGTDVSVMSTAVRARRMCDYVGLEYEYDVTASITQLNDLLEANAIDSKGCLDYLHKVQNHMFVLDTNNKSLDEHNRLKVIGKIFQHDVTPMMLCDVQTSNKVWEDENIRMILDSVDLLIIVVEYDLKTMEYYGSWLDKNYINKQRKCALCVNTFDENIISIRQAAKKFGFSPRYTVKVHWNPWIQKMCNEGKLLELVYSAMDKDPRVLELRQDLKEMCQLIMSIAGMRFRWVE